MPQIKPSFIAEVRSALASSKFTTSDFSIETPDTGKMLIMITFSHRPEYFINLNEEERTDQYTVEQKFLGTTETRRVKEVVYKVRLVPGSVKLADVIELIEPQEFIRQVSGVKTFRKIFLRLLLPLIH
ncbi:MAG: hypothetical protein KGN35_02565 [Betaproteobacteria bacterium]|nr:hypothetical protein [Betaproteobacteria bacterium]